jgi:hypothetical protein
MPTMQTIIQFILIAIASIGIMSAGVRAVEESLRGYVNTRKDKIGDFCKVKTEGKKVSDRITDQFTLDSIQGDCENDEKTKIENDFKTAFVYLACFKEAFLQQEASGSVATSSSSPTCNL